MELGKKYHMDPRTAKRYAESPQKPEYTLTGPKPTKLDPYKQKIDQMLEEAPYSAVRILLSFSRLPFWTISVLLGVYLFSLTSATKLHFFLGVFLHFITGADMGFTKGGSGKAQDANHI